MSSNEGDEEQEIASHWIDDLDTTPPTDQMEYTIIIVSGLFSSWASTDQSIYRLQTLYAVSSMGGNNYVATHARVAAMILAYLQKGKNRRNVSVLLIALNNRVKEV